MHCVHSCRPLPPPHTHTCSVSSVRLGAQAEEEEGANYVSSDSFEALQSALGQMQQEHERLIGTAAHLSHEQEVNTEHIKVRGGDSQLYVMQLCTCMDTRRVVAMAAETIRS